MPHLPRKALGLALCTALVLSLACGGGSKDSSQQEPATPAGTITSLKADKVRVFGGETVRITAEFTGAQALLQPGNIPLTSGQAVEVRPLQDTIYTVELGSGAGTVRKGVQVWARPVLSGTRVLNGKGEIWRLKTGEDGLAQPERVPLPGRVRLDVNGLALLDDGTVWNYGTASSYLWPGTTNPAMAPQQVKAPSLGRVRDLHSGTNHALLLDEAGRVWAWGGNWEGQVGDGSKKSQKAPVLLAAPKQVAQLYTTSSASFALREDGSLWAWGENRNGQLGLGHTNEVLVPAPVSGLGPVQKLLQVFSYAEMAALLQDGTLWTWGDPEANSQTPPRPEKLKPTQVMDLPRIVDFSSDGSTWMALGEDGRLWTWGASYLGDGTENARTKPEPVAGLQNLVRFGWGQNGSRFAQGTNGDLYAWGGNYYGSLGDGTLKKRLSPTMVPALKGIRALSGGFHSRSALMENGDQLFWGLDDQGWGGSKGAVFQTRPQSVALPRVAGLGCSSSRGCVWLQDGSALGWGGGQAQDLLLTGLEDHALSVPTPMKGLRIPGLRELRPGWGHPAALSQDGRVWTWGYNITGALGDGSAEDTFRAEPAPVPGLTDIQSLQVHSSSSGHSRLALDGGGHVWGWGDNFYGQLGLPSGTDSSKPVRLSIPSYSSIQAVALGLSHGLALSQGSVYAWGNNSDKQLGLTDPGTSTWEVPPTLVPGISDVVAVSAGYLHSLALTSDGSVWQWGRFGPDQTPAKPTRVSGLPPIQAISAGSLLSLALARDGSVWAWGSNRVGSLGQGHLNAVSGPVQVPGLSGITLLQAAGSNYAYGNGTLYTWGGDLYGQLGIGRKVYHTTPLKIEGLGY